jgi:hypothetical protein
MVMFMAPSLRILCSMRQRWITMLALGLAGAGCSRGTVRPEPAPAVPSVTASSAASLVDASTGKPAAIDALAEAKAWTDPSAIDALASDCNVAVPKGTDDERTPTSPLTCALEWEQSCSHDPCFEKGQECHAACATTCDGCGTQCATTCGSCKATCAAGGPGDACRRACATTTGACRQACLQSRDKCASVACTKAARVCEADERRKWKAGGCTGKCPAIDSCYMKCVDGKTEDAEKCRGACQKRWPGCDMMYCVMGSPPEPSSATP